MPIVSEDLIFQFYHATAIYKEEYSRATEKVMSSLYVQAIDQYGYQREFSVRYRHRPGDSKDLFWEVSIYQHPGRREVTEISGSSAKRLIGRFLELCRDYPTLLFNEENERMARHTGFVRFAEMLHRGAYPSVKLLK